MKISQWLETHIPDLTGKTMLITGANSGLGFHTAKSLAARGASVILACRTEKKAAMAMQEIRAGLPDADLTFYSLDLMNLEQIGAFADVIRARHERLDGLINNAGIMAVPFSLTRDGFESQWGTNHFGHFALVRQLMPLLRQTPGARVVTVTSGGNHFGRVIPGRFDRSGRYSKWMTYCSTKLANLMLTSELAERIDREKLDMASIACHPGYASTNLQLVGPRLAGSGRLETIMSLINRVLAQPAAMGALPTVYAAASPLALNGDYFGPGRLAETRGFPAKAIPARRAADTGVRRSLWEESGQLTGGPLLLQP